MDVLLTTKPQNHITDELSVIIFWGRNQTLDSNRKTVLNKTFHDEPLIMDFNGDLIPDVFGVTNESDRPQILIGRVTYIKQKPEDTVVVGQSVFADFDGDGQTEHLLPACADVTCHKSAIYLSKPGLNQWIPVLQDFRNKDTLWGFVPYKNNQSSVPITLHIGDYNMDGYPDALAILMNTSGSNQQAFLLENVPCNNASCRSVHRMFKVYWELSDLNQIKDAVVATFFDIYEDGILDIIVLSKGYFNSEFAIHTLKNNFEADAYFVKVIVLSGLCSNDCPSKITPFGVNQPGPYIMYTTVDANGYAKNGSAGQLSQSAHFALQLPYNVLGLGRSANFLDHLYVGIPRPLGEKSERKQEWTAIIPNSQLIVIPYPHNVPRRYLLYS
uniref:Integrin alpha FG-GAP repeat containing 1 n=1 Tax=Terrapene triunguis TaxID=2587831 RepID=A0A674KF93_9SAUR